MQHVAARLNRGEFIRKMVDAGINVNMRRWATHETALFVAVREKHIDCIKILLELNAKVTSYNGVCAVLLLERWVECYGVLTGHFHDSRPHPFRSKWLLGRITTSARWLFSTAASAAR